MSGAVGHPAIDPTGVLAGSVDAMDTARLVAATAANLAGWHDANLLALGFRTAWRDGWWLTPDPVPTIYFRAIAIRPGAPGRVAVAGTAASGWLAVCDPWSDIEPAGTGLSFEADRPWMVQPAGAPDRSTPPGSSSLPDGLSIERVATAASLEAYERTAAIGFEAPIQPAFTWHAPASLRDERMRLWLGHETGRPVATANGFREAGVLGIYSVCTVPDARRRGFASALTCTALADTPWMPAVLQPSGMAESLYHRLGFRRFTTFRTWVRSAT